MFSVKLHPKVDKFIKKSDKQLVERIVSKLKQLKEDPFKFLEHFEGQNFHKFRIGDYRALIDVNTKDNICFVRHLDHRSKIYKRK